MRQLKIGILLSGGCVATKNPMAVMLSAAKHLVFSFTLRRRDPSAVPQDDIPIQFSRERVRMKA